MTRKELEALKTKALGNKEKSGDLDIIISQVMKLPYGQLKKVLTDEVMTVLVKYGYCGEA